MKTVTTNQAIAQILKLNSTITKIQDQIEPEYGSAWYKAKMKNETRQAKIQALYDKMSYYKSFLTEETYNNSDLPCEMCCNWTDFIN